MAKLLGILTLALCSQITAASFPKKAAGEIAAGLVEGFIGASDVKACIEKSVTTLDGLEEAIEDFEKKTASGAIKGLKLLVSAFKGLPNDLTACKASEADVKEIIKAFAEMKSPKSFAFHAGKDLIVNHNDIFHEIFTAVSDYQAQKWLDLGVQVGTALHLIILGADEKFMEFEQKFGKVYNEVDERAKRLEIFKKNLEQMRKFQKVEQGSAVYSHLTPLADLSSEEFAQLNGFKPELAQQGSVVQPAELLDTSDLPDSFDWRDKGAVNDVQNQGMCGSCWAFATVANIEGAGFAENNKLIKLSEQELVDCDKATGDQGCQGGLPSSAYEDMIQNKIGLESESDYPYKGSNGQCNAAQSSEKVFVKSYVNVSTDEDQIAAAVMKYGPLSIGINAGPMQFYFGGVSNPWSVLCNPKSLDHGVAIVGFGVDNGEKYWTIRNSWGTGWGEKGYYRIIRGVGKCGVNTMVTSATGITFSNARTHVVV